MSLDIKQKFIKHHFEIHARAIAKETKRRIDNQETTLPLESSIYISIMVMLEAAFKENKIIVKSCEEWDKLESI